MNPDSFPPVFQTNTENSDYSLRKAPLTEGEPSTPCSDNKRPLAASAEAKTGTPEEGWPDRNELLRFVAYQSGVFLSHSPDSNVEKVRELLLQRSLKGLEKYGCTTDRTDLTRLQWLRHALEEGCDWCVYLMKLISDEEGGK